ncbi:unnamed protein product, partial [marine sediment metagenome]
PPQESLFGSGDVIFSYDDIQVSLGNFKLTTSGSEIHSGEIIGILGPNGIGKTTFINMIANRAITENHKDGNDNNSKLSVSIKSQYIKIEEDKLVSDLITQIKLAPHLSQSYKKRLINNLLPIKNIISKFTKI